MCVAFSTIAQVIHFLIDPRSESDYIAIYTRHIFDSALDTPSNDTDLVVSAVTSRNWADQGTTYRKN